MPAAAMPPNLTAHFVRMTILLFQDPSWIR